MDLLLHIWYTSQETSQNPRIDRISNPQFSAASSRISAESSKGVRGIIERGLQNRQSVVSADL